MQTARYQLDVDQLPPGVVVIDASTEFAPLWSGPVVSVLEELATLSAGRSPPGVAFLGGSELYPVEAVLRGLGGNEDWIEKQVGRCPLLGPLLWKLQASAPRPVVVVTDTPPLDLTDWSVSDFTRRVAFYRLTGAGPVAPGFAEWSSTETELATVARHLADPLKQIRIGGAGTVALDWDDPSGTWRDGLLIVEEPQRSAIVCQFASSDDARPRAWGIRTSGREVEFSLSRLGPRPEEARRDLSRAEGIVLELWRQGNPYYCKSCEAEHTPGRVRCPIGGGDLLPSLAELPSGTVGVVTPRNGGWTFRAVPRGVIPLGDSHVVVWADDNGGVYTAQGDRWVVAESLPARFVNLSDGSYAVRL